jgi:PKD repeat protein
MGAVGLSWPGVARGDSAPLHPADPATPTTVTADPLPTVQINGVAWSQAIVGNTVYVAGKFTSARPAGAPAGSQEIPRNNLLAYDIRTGALVTSFAPSLNAQALVVRASPDGSRIYVGGDFTEADGQPRSRIAAYSTATGQLISDFRPAFNSQVTAIAATDSTVYAGGWFNAVGPVLRQRLAAVSTTGALLPWAPVPGVGSAEGNDDGNRATSNTVLALVVTGGGSQVVASGRFDSMNGVKATGVAAIDAVTGGTRPFAVNQLITNQGVNSAIYSLSTDGTTVYGTGYDFFGPGNVEGSFAAAADGGELTWMNDCHGDTYSSFPMNGALYMATHAHVCSNIGGFPEQSPPVNMFGTAVSLVATGTVGPDTITNNNFTGKPAPSLLPWFPTFYSGTFTGQYQAGWSVTGNGQYLVYGGEFPGVNGTTQQGLVRFAMPQTAPNKVGPAARAELTPAVTPVSGGVRVSWRSTSDRDNENLTYRVYRDSDTAAPVHEIVGASTWWNTPVMSFIDTTVTAGSHRYLVTATDPKGNRVVSAWTTAQIASSGTGQTRPYADLVRADGAQGHWPLGEASGSTAFDYAGAADMRLGSGVTRGQAGAIAGDTNTAFQFNGTSAGTLATQSAIPGPQTFSVEVWFQTSTKAGGKLIGFGDKASGWSSNYDRHVYMDTSGRLVFGVHPGVGRTVSSAKAYNDGKWHHVVASLSSAGMVLYVDGAAVASRTDTTSAQKYNGYWRVGGDSGWSGGGTWFNGHLDEVAVYGKALSADRVANHHSVGSTGAHANLLPVPRYTVVTADLTASFDAGGSTDTDGHVAGYAWSFGDGATATGVAPQHAYTAEGSYAVTLTVTDEDGGSARVTRSVTVTAPPPNAEPNAAFTARVRDLRVSVDGAGSTDTDGSVVAYAWDFGDGATATGVSASHTYTAAGTYRVRLTVTDDDGASRALEQSVTVTAPAEALAADGFSRTSPTGLGAADVGGQWSVSSAARTSATGGAGHLQLPGASETTAAFLDGVSAKDVSVQVALSVPTAPTGGGVYTSVVGRHVGSTDYRVVVRITPAGQVHLTPVRVVAGAQKDLRSVIVPGLTYTPGTRLLVRVDISGSDAVNLRAKAWNASGAEPAAWQVEGLDTAGALPAGGVGLSVYLSGSATTAVRMDVDDLWVGPAGSAPPAPSEPAPNAAPVAAFTSAVSDLTAAFDAAGSTDADGSVASYAWAFGDGATGTGMSPSHTYAAAGTYRVRLTVTDDDGAVHMVERDVTVTAPPVATALASDAFERSVPSGLGAADVGGDWTASPVARTSVSGGAGRLQAPAAQTTAAFLNSTVAGDVAVQAALSLAAAPTGGGTYVSVVARHVGSTDYRVITRFLADGRVVLQLMRVESGTQTELRTLTVPGLVHAPGTTLLVRFDVSGTDTATLRAKAWEAGTAEPSGWQITATDTSAALQRPGSPGVSVYVSGSATSTAQVGLDDLWVGTSRSAPAAPEQPGPNAAPTAAFTSAVNGLAASVDAAGSTDPDGVVAAYAWDFGDGATGTGISATHTYGTGGTYRVRLTVTDDRGVRTRSSTRSP